MKVSVRVSNGLDHMAKSDTSVEWARDDSRNALSDSNIQLVRATLARTGSVAFGWHYHFAQGSSRSPLVFGSAEDLLSYMERASPGDHFSLFDLDRVAPYAVAHFGDRAANSPIAIALAHRLTLSGAAGRAHWKALVLIQRACLSDGTLARCSIAEWEPNDFTDDWNESREYVRGPSWPADVDPSPIAQWTGELYAFDETALDFDEEKGESIYKVSPSAMKRSRALIDGKRPDDHGRTPLDGAY